MNSVDITKMHLALTSYRQSTWHWLCRLYKS